MTEQKLEAERARDYGPPEVNLTAIADAWNAYLANKLHRDAGVVNLTAADVARMMAILKILRAAASPGKVDHYMDARVYLNIAQRFSVCKRESTSNAPDARPRTRE